MQGEQQLVTTDVSAIVASGLSGELRFQKESFAGAGEQVGEAGVAQQGAGGAGLFWMTITGSSARKSGGVFSR